ncbi:hypothetical protein MMC27_002408 [Xylographa pallens]|nr:hypothetical protein [Xylographa pallens]
MKSSTATATVEPSATMSRRQPARQARTNPPRNATTAVRPLGGRGSLGGPQDDSGATSATPGFFPAITHFTDSISALPKEMIRHFTMLKEVDAKICGPEEVVKHLVNAALKTPLPTRKNSMSHRPIVFNSHTNTKSDPSAAASIGGMTTLPGHSQEGSIVHQEAPTPVDIAEYSRRQLFHQLRHVMGEQLAILDEKNHVMSTATDALEKQLRRCDSSYIHIDKEISEEARYGNIHHWAYMDRTAEKKGTTAGERTRRDAAIANGLVAAAATTQEGELAALRSEARREAVAARKQRVQHVDSDFDDSRVAKKPTGHGKGRKAADVHAVSNGTGLGINNVQTGTGANPPNKRRKVEKPASAGLLGGLTMERSLSAVFGPTAGNTRGTAGSPRETPAVEIAKKRGRAGTVTNGTGRRRQVKISLNLNHKANPNMFLRTGTAASAVNSPAMASSPIVGTFAVAAVKGGNSPALGAMQRSQSTRGRQNSTQNIPLLSASATTKQTNGNGVYNAQTDGSRDSKPTKETAPSKTEDPPQPDADVRTSSRSNDRTHLKREELDILPPPRSRAERPPSISTTRTGGKASKTATPISSSFPEPTRPRSGRNTEPAVKRSHKKGAGILAQQQLLAAQQAQVEDEVSSSIQGEEEEDDGKDDELRYCYCNGISYGEMVACDMNGCEREWFHLDCVGLSRAPTGKRKSTMSKYSLLNTKMTSVQRNGTVTIAKRN